MLAASFTVVTFFAFLVLTFYCVARYCARLGACFGLGSGWLATVGSCKFIWLLLILRGVTRLTLAHRRRFACHPCSVSAFCLCQTLAKCSTLRFKLRVPESPNQSSWIVFHFSFYRHSYSPKASAQSPPSSVSSPECPSSATLIISADPSISPPPQPSLNSPRSPSGLSVAQFELSTGSIIEKYFSWLILFWRLVKWSPTGFSQIN